LIVVGFFSVAMRSPHIPGPLASRQKEYQTALQQRYAQMGACGNIILRDGFRLSRIPCKTTHGLT
jgi:hypothetical protein